nr:unnamed protein product [Spirometra erinaceieuropaei]
MAQPWFSDRRSRLSTTEVPPFNIRNYEVQAKNIFEQHITGNSRMDDSELYSTEDRMTREWLSTVLKRGTGRDRIIALAYLVKAKPGQCLRHLESLLAMISPAKKQICLKAIDVLTDLFDSALLPSTRPMISFEKRPFEILKKFPDLLSEDMSVNASTGSTRLPPNSREYVLSLWYFENQLKQIYSRFISALENILMMDTIPAEKNHALNSLVTLVARKPESREIYLGFFKAAVEADELPERLTTALLTGISRVAPYLSGEVMSSNVADIDSVFRLVHLTSNFTISLQALNFLFHFTCHQPQLRARYYQSLYRKLADQSVRWTSRGASLLHLIYRSMLADEDAERLSAFVQRLLVVCLTHPDAGFISAALILLEKLRTSGRFASPIICLTQHHIQTTVDENQKMRLLLPVAVGVVKNADNQASDSDEELFVDVSASEDEGEKGEAQPKTTESPEKTAIAAWDHRRLNSPHKNRRNSVGKGATTGYDSSARDPRFAKALHQPCWQLHLASRHAHPTVSLFSKNLLVGQPFKYTGNPFDDLSVLQFIERFAYKKPKSVASSSKAKAAVSKPDKIVTGKAAVQRAKTLAVDSAAYRNLTANQVPSDERFIHSYFNFLDKSGAKKEHDSDASVSDEEFDSYLMKHEKGLIPNDVDEDEELSDFNYTEDEGEAEETETEKSRVSNKGVERYTKDSSSGVCDSDALVDTDGEDEEEEADDLSMTEDGDSEEEFAAKSGKLDMNKLFVSAEEVGDLYDTQDTQRTSKRQKWMDKRLYQQSHGGRKRARTSPLRSGKAKRRR